MKIQKLLEGIIKVPEGTLKDATQFVLTDVLSRMVAYLDQEGEDEDVRHIATIVNKAKSMGVRIRRGFGDFRATSTKPIMIYKNEVDPRYLKVLPKRRHRDMTITLRVIYNEDAAGLGGFHAKGTRGRRPVIEIIVGESLRKFAQSPEYLDLFLRELESVVHHEFMHGIQDFAFEERDEEPSYYNPDNTIDSEKYNLSDVEFTPLIVTDAGTFRAIADTYHSSTGKPLNKEDAKQLFKHIVFPNAEAPASLTVKYKSELFDALYKKDRKRWKKAVKYLYGLVSDYLT